MVQESGASVGRLARDASIPGFEPVKAHEDCGICLDAGEEVAINGCNHMLCGVRRSQPLACWWHP